MIKLPESKKKERMRKHNKPQQENKNSFKQELQGETTFKNKNEMICIFHYLKIKTV